jgi:hypothetical protein
LKNFTREFTPEIWPFVARESCAFNLVGFYHTTFQASGIEDRPYPAPAGWCDVVLDDLRGPEIEEAKLLRNFRCPSGAQGRSHYAMNPNCTAASPEDMVLLFETDGGWNQHGGPKLFTFDNHDPKGGCVLLNDGTVRFIRTQQELNQLRWK